MCEIGQSCDDDDPCTTGDSYDVDCNCIGTYMDADNDGVCDVDDCAPNDGNIYLGASCDDGDACTLEDAYDLNCECSGTLHDNCEEGWH